MTKKYMLTYLFFFYCTSTEAPITVTSENVPGTLCSGHGPKYYYFCKIKRFKFSYSKIYI